MGSDSFLRSYKYYSRLIDARLASGYLTSRPGLYAAPRVIQVGQKLSRAELIKGLRRAGYVESERSNVWNGSFRETDLGIEIQPRRANENGPSVVRIISDDHNKISELLANGISLDSFTLEPEVLSNDLLSKGGKRATVQYSEIPPLLVHAILSIEDHRFFQHAGLDLFGIGRALLRNAGDERMSLPEPRGKVPRRYDMRLVPSHLGRIPSQFCKSGPARRLNIERAQGARGCNKDTAARQLAVGTVQRRVGAASTERWPEGAV